MKTLYYPIVIKYNIDQKMLEDFDELIYAWLSANYEGDIYDNYIYTIMPEDLWEIYDYFGKKADYFCENGFETFEKEIEFINKLVSKNKMEKIIIKLTNDEREVYSLIW